MNESTEEKQKTINQLKRNPREQQIMYKDLLKEMLTAELINADLGLPSDFYVKIHPATDHWRINPESSPTERALAAFHEIILEVKSAFFRYKYLLVGAKRYLYLS